MNANQQNTETEKGSSEIQHFVDAKVLSSPFQIRFHSR
jgi:hypothetical protein